MPAPAHDTAPRSCKPTPVAPTGAEQSALTSPDRGGFAARLPPRAAYRLVLAGRLLQKSRTRIAVQPGERYPMAVLRVIQGLPDHARATLRSAVDFLESLGPECAPSATLRQRWSPPAGASPLALPLDRDPAPKASAMSCTPRAHARAEIPPRSDPSATSAPIPISADTSAPDRTGQ
jgi:hypothetical protein